MLGERRSNSLFAPAAPAEPERKPEQAEVHDISFEERTGRSLFAEAATAPRASELFFAPQEKGVTFAEALSQVQSYLSETYARLAIPDESKALSWHHLTWHPIPVCRREGQVRGKQSWKP